MNIKPPKAINPLANHAEIEAVCTCPCAPQGPHFWDECPYPPAGPCGVGGKGDFDSYVKLFSIASDIIRSRPDAVTGEARIVATPRLAACFYGAHIFVVSV
jgi:hypothetical protein